MFRVFVFSEDLGQNNDGDFLSFTVLSCDPNAAIFYITARMLVGTTLQYSNNGPEIPVQDIIRDESSREVTASFEQTQQ